MKGFSNLVIGEGHSIFPKAIEKVRGDSFVVQNNVHHPTDANLILDGTTKMLSLVSRLAVIFSVVGWRKHEYHRCRAKKLTRGIQRAASSKKDNKDKRLKALYQELIEFALQITDRCKDSIDTVKKCRRKKGIVANFIISELEECIRFTQTQCSLAHRRIILSEKIPHEEKVFSYFEPHTELINRGKSP